MTHTRRPKRPGIPPSDWSLLLAAAVLMAVVVPVAACGDDDAGPVRSDEPPWDLTEIEMPNTEAEVIGVIEAMPAIDGRQPAFSTAEDAVNPAATYYESEEGGFGVGIQALPFDEPPEPFSPDVLEAEGWTIEASVVDPDSDLLWMASRPSPGDEFDVFGLWWADPDGSWFFIAIADTAEFRVKLVDAFITAAGG